MIDFDYWKKLYEDSPEKFDEERDNFLAVEIEKHYEKDTPAYDHLTKLVATVNEGIANVEGAEAKLKVMQLILTQHADELTAGMMHLKDAVEKQYDTGEG